jgi:hypothetical protein
MNEHAYQKLLTANDTGETGSHQAGLHIPKTNEELLEFLPTLDPRDKNPDSWLECVDEASRIWKFRFVYYNNKLHSIKGTRNEFRITHTTAYFRSVGATEGDTFTISKNEEESLYEIRISSQDKISEGGLLSPIKLKGWTKVY